MSSVADASATPASGASFMRRHRRTLAAALVVVLLFGFVYFVLPQIAGAGATLRRLRAGKPAWLLLGILFEALSLASYIALFRSVFSCHDVHIGWRTSYQINMAGVVATKLFSTAGAGGIALTVWALRASGLEPRTIARRMTSFELLLYAVFAAALLIAGVEVGVFAGGAPWTLTLLPACIAALALGAGLSLRWLPDDLDRRFAQRVRTDRGRRLLARVASIPRSLREGTQVTLELLRRPRLGLLGAVAYWGFDIATLWAAFHAFGTPPAAGVLVIAYFVGALANALPIPGGIGGVEGGMIGVLIAFGVHPSLAVLAVLAYRAISFWLPTLPGAAAYIQLRRTVARWSLPSSEA